MKKNFSNELIQQAVNLAESIKADSILLMTETIKSYDLIANSNTQVPIVVATSNEETFKKLVKKAMINTLDIDFLDIKKGEASKNTFALKLTHLESSMMKGIEATVTIGVKKGVFGDKDLIIVLTSNRDGGVNGVLIYEVKKDQLDFSIFEALRERNISNDVYKSVLEIALDIGREGREGRLIGTAFLVGDSEAILNKSKQLIMNPFSGHLIGERIITDPEIKETIKEISQLDGVFIVTGEGVIESAGRYLNVDVEKVDLLPGLGSMHAAVFAMTKETNSIGVTVSKSGGIVRILSNGAVIKTIEPHNKISF